VSDPAFRDDVAKALTDDWFTEFGESDERKISWENAASLYRLVERVR
jgi:hypothetical protein